MTFTNSKALLKCLLVHSHHLLGHVSQTEPRLTLLITPVLLPVMTNQNACCARRLLASSKSYLSWGDLWFLRYNQSIFVIIYRCEFQNERVYSAAEKTKLKGVY